MACDIRLIREVNSPDNRGPMRGQYALQKLLRAEGLSWLHVGGVLQDDEIPWFWCWKDKPIALCCEGLGRPFVVGPNVLFHNSRRPGQAPGEREICSAAHCRLLFTESRWYAQLMAENLQPPNSAPVVVWPYPIGPQPDGPLAARYDLLVYEKSGADRDVLNWLLTSWPRSCHVRYGRYHRDRMIDLARRSCCCVYLSDDDRGPLALAEIMLAGCPAVGLPRGAPWIETGVTGVRTDHLDPVGLLDPIQTALAFDREAVRARALGKFDPRGIVQKIVGALGQVRENLPGYNSATAPAG
jgi:hypothetical protein